MDKWRTHTVVATLVLLLCVAVGASAALAQPNVTQLAFLLDGSSSIDPLDWDIITTGLSNAIADSECMPQDGSVELTVVQFGKDPGAVTEVAPTLITAANAGTVATQVAGIGQGRRGTPLAAGFQEATAQVTGSPLFGSADRQIYNVTTDGEPTPFDTGKPDAVAARDAAIAAGIDEIDAEGIAITDANRDWLRDEIVWPGPGHLAPPFDPPGWVLVVATAQEYADGLCQKITAVVSEADLAVTVSVDNPTPTVGDNVTYTITVENLGPDDTTGVEVTDALPAGVTYVSDTGGGDYSGNVWTVGALAAGATATLEITASVDAGTCDTIITNTAEVTASDLDDPDDTNNSDSADIDVQCADLAVTMSVDNPTPTVGDNVTYTITVENLGPDDTTGVEVTDALPAGVTYVSDTGGGDYSGNVWTVGALAAGATATLEITASVDAGTCDTIITNTAEVTASDLADPDDTNNSDSADIDVQCADLAVTMSVDNAMPAVGDTIVFTIMVENLGPDDTTGVEITDVLPAGLTHVSDTGGGAYDPVSGVWTVGALNVGDTATLEITVEVDAAACAMTVTNTAEVTASDLADPDLTNNVASVDVTVVAEFGDAETPYPGAHHCNFSDEWLGPGVDGEAAMDPDMDGADSDGDGVDGDAYDDGVFPKRYYLTNSLVRLPIWVNTSGEGMARYGRAPDERLYVQGWIDFDADGTWSPNEEVFQCNVAPWTGGHCNSYAANWYNGYQTSHVFEVRFNVPTGIAPPGWTWMRVRLSYGQPVGPTEEASHGEVEDYQVGIFQGADP